MEEKRMSRFMKQKLGKKCIGVMLLFAMVITLMPATKVQAQEMMFPKKIEMILYPNRPKSKPVEASYFSVWHGNGKITQLKNSNKKVVTVEKSEYSSDGIKVTPKSAGISKITFKCSGKKFTCTIKVRKYESPFKLIKIGKKDFTKNFNVSESYQLTGRTRNMGGKLRIKLNKNWKIQSMELSYVENEEGLDNKKVKNNQNIVLRTAGENSDGGSILYIVAKNIKTKEKKQVFLFYNNSPEKIGNEFSDCNVTY